MAKSYEELQFTDDFMFGKVMEDRELCRDVLECLLQEPVGTLQDVQTEQSFQYTSDGKPIRLDVYTKDKKATYDAEMQNLNHKRAKNLELPKRVRFYQSMIDVDFLSKGNSYRLLPEGKVLFLCTFDPFGLGLPQYTFENRCVQNLDLPLYDGTQKFFYNCTAPVNDLPEPLRALYEFIAMGKATNLLTKRIESAIEKARQNEKWRSEYMKEWILFDDARTEGFQAGLEQGLEQGISQAAEQEHKAREEERSKGILLFIQDKLEDGVDKDTILRKLERLYSLSKEDAEQYFEKVNK